MYAILDGVAWGQSKSTPERAYFFQMGAPEVLFTYAIISPGSGDNWTFRHYFWDTPEGAIPPQFHPTLRQIEYDNSNSTLRGLCTVPNPANDQIMETAPCASGTFDAGGLLALNLTSFGALISASNDTTVMSAVRAQDRGWSPGPSGPPSFILKEIDKVSGEPRETVVSTGVTKVSDCTELKVCIAGTGRTPGSVVDAEVLATLGLALMSQAKFASSCNEPKH